MPTKNCINSTDAQVVRLYISTGELSGEKLAAQLVKELLAKRPQLHIQAMGGTCLAAAGAQVVLNNRGLGVVGASEVLKHLKKIRQTFKQAIDAIELFQPHAVVLVDYSGFHLRLAKALKARGFKVIYYVSPQLWATRYRRIHTIRRAVDHMMVLYPFEQKLYQKEHISATYVGHPLVKKARALMNKQEALAYFSLKQASPIIGLLPGSRTEEVKTLMPILAATAQKLLQRYPQAQFVIPIATDTLLPLIKPYSPSLPLTLLHEKTFEQMAVMDLAIAKSGTSTLELLLMHVPMVIINKKSWLTYLLFKLFMRIPYIGLCNILADTLVAPELVQHKATSARIFEASIQILDHPEEQQRIKNAWKKVHQQLTDSSSRSASDVIGTYLEPRCHATAPYEK